MHEQQGDTAVMASAVTALKVADRQIDQRFSVLKQKAKNLEQDWNSRAGYTAMSRLYEIFSGNESRSQVLKNFISYISEQVEPGYQNVVKMNKRLSDLYK